MKKIYLISIIVVFIGITSGITYFITRDANAKIPENIVLVNQDGKDYKIENSNAEVKLVEFIYTHCPDICPTTTQKMNLLRKELIKQGLFGKKVKFITITIDPYRDSPEVLQDYMDDFGIISDGNWQLLTAHPNRMKEDQKKIKSIADTFKFQYRDPGNGFYVHSTFTYLVDENNQFIKKFPMGGDFNKDEVYKEIMKEL
ncbi:SCO family protein [Bacillus massilinigeriensis]|uniref:SCO family protein n=1 Tax=Bacillus mediterraneensis TaxID=1805474 RepID=UPI0008F811B5|nr:SCO family protein [Bacillus mediterraneensis]